MIIKFLSRKSNSKQLLAYVLRYIMGDSKRQKITGFEELKNTPGTFLIKHNIRARTLKGFIREFDENEAFRLVRRKDSVKVFHTVISFGTKDRELITDQILKEVGKKFIQERGANCLYIGTKHEDRGHIHLHMVYSGTQLNGRSARLSNQKFRSIKLNLDRFQRENYPFLVHSLPDYHKETKLSKEALITRLKFTRQTLKAGLQQSLEIAFTGSKSQAEFLEAIRSMGHEPYSRAGKIQGVLFEGKTKYRFSRLGFSQGRLQELDFPIGPEKLLSLDLLKGPDEQIKKIPAEKSREVTELEALAAIRERSQGKELERERVDDIERMREIGEDSSSEEGLGNDSMPLFLPATHRFLSLPLKAET